MSISCGKQCINCPFPIHIDTYSGCSHACKYCFANEKLTIKNIRPMPSANVLRKFIEGKRTLETKWCNWDIPLHWGANSDPFQACETEYKCTLECLKIFAETGYPFIVSTKNPVLATTEPYLSLLDNCKCVFQVSMACSDYDRLETGAPCYEDRLKALSVLSKHCTRTIIRIQPYFTTHLKQITAEMPRYKQAGAYGIILEGFKTKKKHKGMIKDGSRYQFSFDTLSSHFKKIKAEAHKNGLVFYCSDDGLDHLSDDLLCCGTTGLEDFKPNYYTMSYVAYQPEKAVPTEPMNETGTTRPFRSFYQSQAWELHIKDKSYTQMFDEFKDGYVGWLREMQERYGEQDGMS